MQTFDRLVAGGDRFRGRLCFKSGGGSNTTSKTVAEPWKGVQPFLHELVGDTSQAYQGGMFDIPPYPGMRIAPQSGLTQEAMQGFFNTGTGGNPYMAPTADAFGRMVSGDVRADLDQVKQNVLADVVPATSHLFSQSGMLDSSMAADTVGRSAAEAVAPYEYGAWENAQNRSLTAMGMAPDLSAMRYLDPQMMMMAGQQQDQYGQRLADAAMQTYYEGAQQPFDQLQRASSLGLGFGGTGGTQSTTQGGGSGAMQTIGGIMQAASFPLMMAMMSERRIKTGVRRIGETAEGYPKYEFRYLWDEPGTVRVGVMADEVPPEIVHEIGGFKVVDYSRVTL